MCVKEVRYANHSRRNGQHNCMDGGGGVVLYDQFMGT